MGECNRNGASSVTLSRVGHEASGIRLTTACSQGQGGPKERHPAAVVHAGAGGHEPAKVQSGRAPQT